MKEKYREDYRNLGLNINYYRRKKDLTQLQLSDILDVDSTYISRIELGKSSPSLDVLLGISEALEVPIAKLFESKE